MEILIDIDFGISDVPVKHIKAHSFDGAIEQLQKIQDRVGSEVEVDTF